jgi:hypothetical protein
MLKSIFLVLTRFEGMGFFFKSLKMKQREKKEIYLEK